MSPVRSPETDPPRPTLRQRGADLKAGLARVLRCPAPQGTARLAAAAPPAPVPADPPAALADACDWAVAHMAWINGDRDPWPDERLEAEVARFDAVLERAADEPSNGPADLAAKARLLLCELRTTVDAQTTTPGGRALVGLLREVAAFGASAGTADRLVADIIAGWAGYAAVEGGDDERAFDRVYAARGALLDAADALPATRDNLTAKALALAWISYVHLWERGRERADYATDGRLAVDIGAIIRGAADAPVAPSLPRDAIHAAIAAARAANAAIDAFGARTRDRKPKGWFQAEQALVGEQNRTADIAYATVPTTRAGRVLLADFMAEQMARHGMANGDPPDPDSPMWATAYVTLSAALRAPSEPEAAGHDLSVCTLPQLARLYEAWSGIHRHVTGAGNAPCFQRDGMCLYTPAGEILDLEYDRTGQFLDAIADEVRSRQPQGNHEIRERLAVLIRHELEMNDRIVDPALRAELTASWGAR